VLKVGVDSAPDEGAWASTMSYQTRCSVPPFVAYRQHPQGAHPARTPPNGRW
jgi:hypothetical protein